jgi:ABC-type glutathione transport system ATPase component
LFVGGVPVLRDVNALIRPGERIGIVGRTGAGKTNKLHDEKYSIDRNMHGLLIFGMEFFVLYL